MLSARKKSEEPQPGEEGPGPSLIPTGVYRE